MAWTEQNLRNHDFYARTLDDLRVVLENTTARDLEQYELVILNGYFGEVLNVEDVANGEDAIVNIDSMRTIRTDQVGAAQTFVVGDKIWFDPNGAAVGALYDSEDASDYVAVGVVTAIYAGNANVEFRPFAQDSDITLIRAGAALADAVVLNTAHKDTVAGNPHVVTVAELSLDNVDNTSDLLKPPSTAQIALNDSYALNAIKTAVLAITADSSGGITFTKAALGMSVGDKIVDMLIMCTTSEANGTLKVGHVAGNDITDAGICAVANAISRGLTLDQAEVVLGAAELVVTGAGGTPANIRGIVYLSYIPV